MQRENMLIEADELRTKLNDPNLRIYDATILFFRKDDDVTAREKYQQRHIPRAAFFDHQQLSDANSKYMYMVLPEEELATQIGDIGISADSEVVLYTSEMLPCATRAWWLLRYAGHNNVRVLNGGLAAWEAAGGAIASGGCQYEATTFEGQLRADMFADKEEVLAAIGNGDVCTVHTLMQEVYDSAHIRGSTNLSFGDLTTEMSAFDSTAQLASRLAQEAQHERIITYCGGGIGATVNAMAHLLAGNKNVAVYDGSMDEWAGEGLPMDKSTDKDIHKDIDKNKGS